MPERETDLYQPVKYYLQKLGFRVDAEVNSCDIVASLKSDIIIVELKNSFSLKLLFQAVDRQKLSNNVYVAIANRTTKRYPPNVKNIKNILLRLNIGLLIVHFRKSSTDVEPVIEPKNLKTKINRKKRTKLLKELDGRYKNFNIGGSTSSQKQITTYLLNSIQIAVLLNKYGQSSPAQLQKRGSSSNTQSILYKNYRGWFNKITRGIYVLNSEGKAALVEFSEQSSYFKQKL